MPETAPGLESIAILQQSILEGFAPPSACADIDLMIFQPISLKRVGPRVNRTCQPLALWDRG
jgi:hypothetical protein